MAYFSEIDNNNVVLRVIVVADSDCAGGNYPESEPAGQEFISSIGISGTWKQTSFNTWGGQHKTGGFPLRKNFGETGFIYDSGRDAFIPPQPYPSWILNEQTCLWEAPVDKPDEEIGYIWDEPSVSWIKH
jgi:hypothetical protein